MHSIFSLLSGAIMVVLVYGLSFCPSATLGQIDDVEETTSRADQDGTNPTLKMLRRPLVPCRAGLVAKAMPARSRDL